MGTSKAEGKRSLKEMEYEEEEAEEEEENGDEYAFNEVGFGESDDKKKRGNSSKKSIAYCQVENCATDMSNAKPYHRRHKVCEFHAKAPVVSLAGLAQRFCQQCSRFHEVSEFDEAKKSCRSRLAGHNERRRKSSSLESHGEGLHYSNAFGRQM